MKNYLSILLASASAVGLSYGQSYTGTDDDFVNAIVATDMATNNVAATFQDISPNGTRAGLPASFGGTRYELITVPKIDTNQKYTLDFITVGAQEGPVSGSGAVELVLATEDPFRLDGSNRIARTRIDKPFSVKAIVNNIEDLNNGTDEGEVADVDRFISAERWLYGGELSKASFGTNLGYALPDASAYEELEATIDKNYPSTDPFIMSDNQASILSEPGFERFSLNSAQNPTGGNNTQDAAGLAILPIMTVSYAKGSEAPVALVDGYVNGATPSENLDFFNVSFDFQQIYPDSTSAIYVRFGTPGGDFSNAGTGFPLSTTGTTTERAVTYLTNEVNGGLNTGSDTVNESKDDYTAKLGAAYERAREVNENLPSGPAVQYVVYTRLYPNDLRGEDGTQESMDDFIQANTTEAVERKLEVRTVSLTDRFSRDIEFSGSVFSD